MQTIAQQAGALLPRPRFLFKKGQVIDRWSNRQYDARPVVLVSILNRLADEGTQDADAETTRRLAERADAVERLLSQRDDLDRALKLANAEIKRLQRALTDPPAANPFAGGL